MEGTHWGAEGYDPEEESRELAEERAAQQLTEEERAELEQQVRREAQPTPEELRDEVNPPMSPEEELHERYGRPADSPE